MRHKATLPPILPVFGPLEATNLGEWGQKLVIDYSHVPNTSYVTLIVF